MNKNLVQIIWTFHNSKRKYKLLKCMFDKTIKVMSLYRCCEEAKKNHKVWEIYFWNCLGNLCKMGAGYSWLTVLRIDLFWVHFCNYFKLNSIQKPKIIFHLQLNTISQINSRNKENTHFRILINTTKYVRTTFFFIYDTI